MSGASAPANPPCRHSVGIIDPVVDGKPPAKRTQKGDKTVTEERLERSVGDEIEWTMGHVRCEQEQWQLRDLNCRQIVDTDAYDAAFVIVAAIQQHEVIRLPLMMLGHNPVHFGWADVTGWQSVREIVLCVCGARVCV